MHYKPDDSFSVIITYKMPIATVNEKPHVLIVGEVNTDAPAFERFAQEFEYSYYQPTTRQAFVKDMTTIHSHVQALWCTWGTFSTIGGLDAELIAFLPDSLKIIVSCAVGYDLFDATALAARNIALCNSPGLAADPVADHVLYQTLALFRYYSVFENLTRAYQHTDMARCVATSSEWDLETGRPILEKKPSAFSFGQRVGDRDVKQPRGHNVGIVGFGAIGKEIGQRLSAIGMNVHYTKTCPLSDTEVSKLGYPVTFHTNVESMFPMSDLLVLACPLNSKTKHMVNKNTIALLPKGAKIINIGRGALIDTRALINALKSGHLTGVALDVFEKEPVTEEELCNRWDVLLTPHIGSSTMETALGAEEICVNNMINELLGDGKSLTKVN